ncbi:hypothetical protein GCM10020370_71470 [Paenibacillus hodogayensis]
MTDFTDYERLLADPGIDVVYLHTERAARGASDPGRRGGQTCRMRKTAGDPGINSQ